MSRRFLVLGLGALATTQCLTLAAVEESDDSGPGGDSGVGSDAVADGVGSEADALEEAPAPGCQTCLEGACKKEKAACDASPQCKALASCRTQCDEGDIQCRVACYGDQYDVDAGSLLVSFTQCLSAACLPECGLLGVPGAVGCLGNACAAGQVCCASPLFLRIGAFCGKGAAACTGGAVIRCDGPEDCPGQTCCAVPSDAGIGFSGTECRASCGTNANVVCGGQPDVCPSGGQCLQGLVWMCQ